MRRIFVRLSAWLFGSCATASIAHALISLADRFAPNAYAERAHGEASVLALTLATTLSIVWFVAAARAFAGRDDISCALARDVRGTNVAVAASSTALGGALALAGVESLEQISASGHVGTIADMLGGNASFGVFAILVAAVALVAIGRSIALWLFAFTARSASMWLSWVATSFARTAPRGQRSAWRLRNVRARSAAIFALMVRSLCGLRAPPRLAGHVPT